MKKILICLATFLQITISYGLGTLEEVNINFVNQNTVHDSQMMKNIIFCRHGETGKNGHTVKDAITLGITEAAKNKAEHIGQLIRSFCYYLPAYHTDGTARCVQTLDSICNVDYIADSSQDLDEEIDLGMTEDAFRFISQYPATLFNFVKNFESKLPTTNEYNFDFVDPILLEMEKISPLQNTILKSFLDVIRGDSSSKFAQSLSKSYEKILSNTENSVNNFYVHHSMFISTNMFIAQLNSAFQAANITDLYQKVNESILENPKKNLSQYLDLFITCFTQYRPKNLNAIYTLYAKDENGINNFYICPLDYIKDHQLPLYEILKPKESSSFFSKFSSLAYMFYNEPWVAYNFIRAEDNLNRKNYIMSFGRNDEQLTIVGQTAASIFNLTQQAWEVLTYPLYPLF